jgi:glycosyltransferase involved in cell wall biosynthesis
MKICKIWHGDYPWDVRVEKIVNTLTAAGHEVCLICANSKNLPREEKINEKFKIFRLPAVKNKLANTLISFPLFFNPFWHKIIKEVILKEKIQLILVRDLPLVLTATKIGKKYNIPVVFDMAENFPAALQAYENPIYGPLLMCNVWLPKKIERLSIKMATHILVVTEEQAERLNSLGIPKEKLTIVRNTPDLSFLRLVEKASPDLKENNGLTLLYIGKIDPHRGIGIAIKALSDVAKQLPQAKLILIGEGKSKEKLITMVKELGLENNVRFTGWLDLKTALSYIKVSDICLIPHLVSAHTDTTLPNKIFDYMALAKPVIVSNARPLERIVKEERCGLVFRSEDAQDLAEKILQLQEKELRDAFGSRGKESVMRKYNWNNDAKNLLNSITYSQLVNSQ